MSLRAPALLLLAAPALAGLLSGCASNCGPGGYALPPSSSVVVRDSRNSTPIDDANVTVSNADGGVAYTLSQGFNGAYRAQVPAGDYTVMVSRRGYTTATSTLSVSSADLCNVAGATLNVNLVAAP